MNDTSLSALLGPELAVMVQEVTSGSFLITIPDPASVDRPLEELASLVAVTANHFGRAARFAGLARAEAKLAKGRFERKYKRARKGPNDAERDAAAMTACSDEHAALSVAEAIAELADAMEAAGRVASESARKLHAAAESGAIAEARAARGTLRDSDYADYRSYRQ